MAQANDATLVQGAVQETTVPISAQIGNKLLLGAGVAAVLAVMVVFWLWSQQSDYRVLFSNYADKDGGAIVASLEQMNVPYKFSQSGAAILVPAEHVHTARLKLAAEGLPKGGNIGFELLEQQKFGVSQFVEQVNFQRALEGELERSIQAIAAVQNARIHLAIPKPSVFVREQQKPTASVLLNLHMGRDLDQQQVDAIVHLVASSVPDLRAKSVTVVDQNGSLLSDASKKAMRGLDATQLKYIDDIQASIARRVESIITPIVGRNNVRAEVSAEIDFTSTEQAAETYKPNTSPDTVTIRSSQSSESSTVNGGEATGVPGALSNQPPVESTAPIEGGDGFDNNLAAPATPVNSQKNTTTNYEVDKTVSYSQQAMGGVKRLNVAVVVNHLPVTDENGNVSLRALTEAEKTQINDLAMQAMGFNQARGDAITVVNTPFAGEPQEVLPEIPVWQNPAVIEYGKDVLRFLAGMIVLLLIYKKALKPLVTRLVAAPVALAKPTAEGEAIGDQQDPDALVNIQNPEAQQAQLANSAYEQNLSSARQLAKDNPRVVASVVSNWTNGEK